MNWVTDRNLILGLTAAISALSGAAIGAAVAIKTMKSKYEAIADHEIRQAKEFYKKQYKQEEYSTPEKAVEALKEDNESDEEVYSEDAEQALVSYHGRSISNQDIEEKLEVLSQISNVFDTTLRELDWGLESEVREKNEVYVISVEEFTNNESDYEQMNLMYYEGDGVLCDDRDQLVEPGEADALLQHNLQFGYGSEDKNVVYIRNVKRQAEFEVIRNPGSYQVQVLGLSEDSIQHSDRKKPRKFRGDYE